MCHIRACRSWRAARRDSCACNASSRLRRADAPIEGGRRHGKSRLLPCADCQQWAESSQPERVLSHPPRACSPPGEGPPSASEQRGNTMEKNRWRFVIRVDAYQERPLKKLKRFYESLSRKAASAATRKRGLISHKVSIKWFL